VLGRGFDLCNRGWKVPQARDDQLGLGQHGDFFAEICEIILDLLRLGGANCRELVEGGPAQRLLAAEIANPAHAAEGGQGHQHECEE